MTDDPNPVHDDELLAFLDCFHLIFPNLNDTFAYATADTERIALDCADDDELEGNTEALVRVWREFGMDGVVAYVALMREEEPIGPRRTEAYQAAVRSLVGWSYESD